ncbi:LysR family transcriptional regulator [Mycolicibacterium goodii]|uniref:Probable hydrogen peroxide-inducible genes activator n=1 Tax=Mycolicibacterium goodii TaxID=134601 RepID=A0A0K0XGI8_MYCGD|nr:LysR family transcriptional regulator [Mycolicibacterium goodii]
MHLDWLTSFLAVARHRSFLAAAQQLGRVQSRVSEHVAKLERELGVVLVDRAVRPVRLTVAGEIFLGRAKDVLATLDSARAEMAALRGTTYGTVRLACMSSAAGEFASRLIDRFGKVEHNIDVQVLEGPTSTLPEMLQRHEADLAILPQAYVANFPELQSVSLWDEPLRVLVPPAHRLASMCSVPLGELAGEAVVTPGSGDGARGLSPEIAAMFAAADVQVGAGRRVASPHTLVSMVRSGLGVGVLSELAVRLTGADGVVVLPFEDSSAVRHTVLAWPRERRNAEAVQRFSDFVVSAKLPDGTVRSGASGRGPASDRSST